MGQRQVAVPLLEVHPISHPPFLTSPSAMHMSLGKHTPCWLPPPICTSDYHHLEPTVEAVHTGQLTLLRSCMVHCAELDA